jgi:hypothetical protein
MSKIRMNTEYRNKLYNRIKDVFEKEDTQERQAFLEARENFENKQTTAFELARQVVERSYPKEDVATLRHFKKKYGDPCDVVAKDKCFYFAHSEDVDEDGDQKETKSHFDFSLYGNLNGKGRYGDAIGMTSKFDKQFLLDVIGTSHCRSRAIACTKDEYQQFEEWRMAKANVVSKHQTWIDSITKQTEQLKIGLKAYRYLSEGIELAKELGIELDEAELVRTNSTGLTIYNPSNLANLIKGMKNKTQTREQKIALRKAYEQSVN